MKILEIIEIQVTSNYAETMASFEKRYLEIAVSLYDGNLTHTAKNIGIPKSTLCEKANKYNLNTLTPGAPPKKK